MTAPSTAPADLILRNATLADGTRADLAIRDGYITRIAPEIEDAGTPIEDVHGQLALPSFVDLHMHLDKAFTLDLTRNESGTLTEAITRFGEIQPRLTHEGFVERALHTLRLCLAAGTTAVRTHVNVDVPASNGGAAVRAVEALLEVRERVREWLDVQIVLLPTGNIAAQRALYAACEEALRQGADALGGAPALYPDHDDMIASTFALAAKYDREIDLHVDETDDPTMCTLDKIARLTLDTGYSGRVTAGHCCSLAAMEHATAARVVERVAAAGMTIITLPSCNLYLQGRGDVYPVRRGLTRVKELQARGVNVAAASDNIRDPFNPFGRGDLLHIADLLAHAAHLGSPDEQSFVRDAISANPRACFTRRDPAPLRGGLLREGDLADLVVCATGAVDDLIAAQPTRTLVLRRGRVVACTRTTTETII